MLFRNLRTAFVSGMLMLAPVGVTLFVINFLIQRIGVPTREFLFFFIPRGQAAAPLIEYVLYLAAILIVCVFITGLGWLSQRLLGRMLLKNFERLVDSVPLVRSVYNTVKQIRDTFMEQNKAVFQRSVLVEFPRKDAWMIGFLTSEGKGEIQLRTDSELVNVFVPTTPNPTSGFLLMIPREQVHELEMSIGDAMKLIISGGAVVPPWRPGAERMPMISSNAPAAPVPPRQAPCT